MRKPMLLMHGQKCSLENVLDGASYDFNTVVRRVGLHVLRNKIHTKRACQQYLYLDEQ